MNANIKKIIKIVFYPLILMRRYYYRKRNKYLGLHNPQKLADIIYYQKFGQHINWNNPLDINEKINWLKFNTDTSIWTRLSDKILVREYVKEKGLSEILVPLYGVWDTAEDIDWESLPNSFVLKSNHGCETVLLVNDKTKIDFSNVKSLTSKWLKFVFGITTAEPHYIHIKPRLMAEEYLKDETGLSSSIVDYKFFCLGGQPYAIMVGINRTIGIGASFAFYDTNWNLIPDMIDGSHKYDKLPQIPCPKNLNKMLEVAKILSHDFPQVRVDLYECGNKIYFGELTFTSLGGYMDYISPKYRLEMGKLIKLQ